ncbi:uncharacterized protein LOC122787342 [Protopterus annectens]|uniref:uncharacterized protein LOC122787342 n=1 Tax=Protopterus annectens TaxID=7888 RepID=UPI001CFAC0D8|nr:uncharacterized protein LOC122787342 [Protopterus annectens]
MSAQRLPANCRELKEFDSVKESIADIINQLQDIDPSRLSFSPFLDLDTQISLAPVSDSPESSLEELNSISEEASIGFPEEIPSKVSENEAKQTTDGSTWCPEGNKCVSSILESSRKNMAERLNFPKEQDDIVIMIPNETSFLNSVEVDIIQTPESKEMFSHADEHTDSDEQDSESEEQSVQDSISFDHPFVTSPSNAETIELVSQNTQDDGEDACHQASVGTGEDLMSCCNHCTSSHLKAVSSVFVSLLLVPWILYGLYMYLPFEPTSKMELTSRIAFTLCCMVVTVVPITLGVVIGSVCRLCSVAINPQDTCSHSVLLHQRYVTSSVEQFTIYFINLVALATFLEQEHLKIIPILAGLFTVGRLIYWISLGVNSEYRGFGYGLTFFPALAMTAYNFYCLYQLGFGYFLEASQGSHLTTQAPTSRLQLSNLGG